MFKNIWVSLIALGTASTAFANTGGQALAQFLPLILIFAIFYFLLIRPQQKRQKDHQNKLKAIGKGNTIITGGGIKGKVKKASDTELQVEIANGVVITVLRATVMDVPANPTAPAAPAAATDIKKR